MKTSAPTYRWDELHKSSCAIPQHLTPHPQPSDPPDLEQADELSHDEQMSTLLEYMNYMEGLAEGLPRVLYVHGSGQEIINFEH